MFAPQYPKLPQKPFEPSKPDKTIRQDVEVYRELFSDDYSIDTLVQLTDSYPDKELLIHIETVYQDRYDEFGSDYIIVYYFNEIDNPNYNKQYQEYSQQLETYNKALDKYNTDMEIYSQQSEVYDLWQNKRYTDAIERAKKYNLLN